MSGVTGRTEQQEQMLVIDWARLNRVRWPELEALHAVQNWAGVKNRIEAAFRKREGVEAGVPDLHLPVPRGGWASLYIEMKRVVVHINKTKPPRLERTEPTPAQLEWHARLERWGNCVQVCWSAEEAQAVLEQYLRGQLTREAA